MATLRLAHRGDWRRAPENTIPALLAAMAVPGCDGVEIDVRASLDGVPVLSHDETLERVWGRPERVDSLRTDALEAIGLPTLAEVLERLPRSAYLDVEFKGDPGRGAVEVLAAGRGAGLRGAVVSSFEAATLERVAGLAPAWPRWLNTWDLEPSTVATAAALGCRGISVAWSAIDQPGIRRARVADLDLAAWTIRRRPTFRRLARLGAVAVCVEGPALDG